MAAAVDDLDPLATLFIVASKSGTTTEPLAFMADAWARIEKILRDRHAPRFEHAGEMMVAISDPGKSIESIPHHDGLREYFLNPPDIGGRYSALTYVGLVPASLIGLDLDALLASAGAMLAATREPDPELNPGVGLGLAIGTLAKSGRDKLTFLADPEIASFGAWVEQLHRREHRQARRRDRPRRPRADRGDRPLRRRPGVRPPAARRRHRGTRRGRAGERRRGGRPPRHPDRDRRPGRPRRRVRPLGGRHGDRRRGPGHRPVRSAQRRGSQAADPRPARRPRWRVGAGREPDRDRTADSRLYGDAPLRLSADGERTLAGELRRHLDRRRPNAYLAIQAFIAPSAGRDAAIARIRALLRDATGNATTAGYGPRFLHSTGQLHKGGPPIGWFLQLTADHPVDRPIPGWPYTFGRLIDAQAQGDFESIEAHDLPIVRVHLADPDADLAQLEAALALALLRE